MVDVERLKVRLRANDALRDEDQIVGNMALLLRRFFLQLNRLGVSPRIFLINRNLREPRGARGIPHWTNPSGIGVAKKLLEVFPQALEKGVEIARNCGCKDGCQNCIEPAKRYDMSATKIDKTAGIRLAEIVLSTVANSQGFEYRNGRMVPLRTQSD